MLLKLKRELSSLFLKLKTLPLSLLNKYLLTHITTIIMLIKNKCNNRNRMNNIIITMPIMNNNRMSTNNITKRKRYLLKKLKLKQRLNPSTLIQLKHTLLLKFMPNNPLQLASKLKPLKNLRRKLIKNAITLAITAIDLQEKVLITPMKVNNRIKPKRVKKVM